MAAAAVVRTAITPWITMVLNTALGTVNTITCTEISLTVPGVTEQNMVIVSIDGLPSNLAVCNAVCSAKNVVTFRLVNPTAGNIVAGTRDVNVLVF